MLLNSTSMQPDKRGANYCLIYFGFYPAAAALARAKGV